MIDHADLATTTTRYPHPDVDNYISSLYYSGQARYPKNTDLVATTLRHLPTPNPQLGRELASRYRTQKTICTPSTKLVQTITCSSGTELGGSHFPRKPHQALVPHPLVTHMPRYKYKTLKQKNEKHVPP
ncbi:unnamed protein product [Ectocarpus sp. 8 AP-2014]